MFVQMLVDVFVKWSCVSAAIKTTCFKALKNKSCWKHDQKRHTVSIQVNDLLFNRFRLM